MDQIPREKRIKKAVDALMKGQYPSKAACAKAHGISPSTFSARFDKAICLPSIYPKITEDEEDALCEWMYDTCRRGLALQSSDVRYMLKLILSARLKASSRKPTVNEEWIKNFIDIHIMIDSELKRRESDRKNLNCEDPEIINNWFRRVQDTVQKYGILEQDIYNMDVLNIQMDTGSTPDIISGAQARYKQGKKGQREDRDSVSLIIAINAKGTVLPPQFVLTGIRSLAQYHSDDIPEDYRIWESANGWADDTSKLRWIEMFDTLTAPHTVGKYRLLIVDGWRSHATAIFDRFCTDRKIIPLYLPPHTTHLLQPLDVGCAVPLRCLFSRQINERMETGSCEIQKNEIISIYSKVHDRAFPESNIINGFAEAGLVPLCPKQVLAILEAEEAAPLPPIKAEETTPLPPIKAEETTPPPPIKAEETTPPPPIKADNEGLELELTLEEIISRKKQKVRSYRDIKNRALSLIEQGLADRDFIRLYIETRNDFETGFRGFRTGLRLKREYDRMYAFYKHLDGGKGEEEKEEEEEEDLSTRTSTGTQRPTRCGICRNEGHNRSTCPAKQMG